MIKFEKIKALKQCKSQLEFIHKFNEIFKQTLIDNLNLLELDYFIELLIQGDYHKIRIDLGDMSDKAKDKILACVEESNCDEVYEARYRGLKELEDLITYFIEEEV